MSAALPIIAVAALALLARRGTRSSAHAVLHEGTQPAKRTPAIVLTDAPPSGRKPAQEGAPLTWDPKQHPAAALPDRAGKVAPAASSSSARRSASPPARSPARPSSPAKPYLRGPIDPAALAAEVKRQQERNPGATHTYPGGPGNPIVITPERASSSSAAAPSRAVPARQITADQRAAATKVQTAQQQLGQTAVMAAARALDAYVRAGGRERSRFADWQWTLGLDADGIPGTKTRDAVRAQLGTEPAWAALSAAQVKGDAPGGASPREAAERLERYAQLGGKKPERIKPYQRVLKVTADGALGPNTRAAAEKALGRKGRWQ